MAWKGVSICGNQPRRTKFLKKSSERESLVNESPVLMPEHQFERGLTETSSSRNNDASLVIVVVLEEEEEEE